MNALKMYLNAGAGLAAVLILALAAALPAAAATFTVNSTVDAPDADLGDGICADATGLCTLRAAIMQANALGGTNVIDLSQIADPSSPIILAIPGVDETVEGNPGTGYQVVDAHDASRGDLNITSSMDIIGAGADKTVIEWSPNVKQNPADGDRVFHIEAVSSNITVNISGVSIENGVTPPAEIIQTLQDGTYYQLERSGAGIAIGPAATVTYVNPSAPTGHGSDSGGSPGDEGGGGQHGGDEGEESSATITGVTLTDVKLLNNQSGAAGGGLSNAAPLTLTNVDISGNSAVTNGGGIYNDAQLTVVNSTIGTTGVLTTPNSAEGGGGIFDTGMHSTVIEGSAIDGNKATGGGGLSVRSMVSMDIVNTTIDGNAAADVGGGMTSNGSVTLQNDTIADNSSANDSTGSGAGINAFGKGSYSFVNTLFQGNSAVGSGAPANCGCSGASCNTGVMNSLGHNLADDATCSLSGAGDLADTNAQLQALASNGGPTQTRALLSSSPAVDAGDNANCPNTDQRGSMRPADGSLRNTEVCDIGAFELFIPRADLHVSSKGGPDRTPHGAAANASFGFTNDSTTASEATGVVITTQPIPQNYSITSATMTTSGGTTDCAFDTNTRVITCNVGTLAHGQSVRFDISGTGDAPGEVTITATISAASPTEISPDNNTATVTMLIQSTSNVGVTATGPGQQPRAQGPAALNFSVSNAGPDAANNVRVLAIFRNRMSYQKMQIASGGTCTLLADQLSAVCDCGTVAAGQSVTGTLDLLATSAGTADVEFQVESDDVDLDDTNNSIVVPVNIAAESTTPAVPTTPAVSISSGGGGCVFSPDAPFDPTLIAALAVGMAGIGVRRFRRAPRRKRAQER